MLSTSITSKDNIASLAIGRFDGVHLGHRALFAALGENGGIFVVDNGLANLTPNDATIATLTGLPVFRYPLESIHALDAAGFVARLRADFPKLRKIVVGYDFRFGRDRAGDAVTLTEVFEGRVEVVAPVQVGSEIVHARLIRRYILEGEVAHAATLLGRPYELCGDVVHGQGIGRQHLYATINIKTKRYLLPAEGVYASRVEIKGEWLDAVTFLGHRVSTDGNFAIESHILDREILEQPESCCVRFIGRIRPNAYFDTTEELKAQIGRDLVEARALLSE